MSYTLELLRMESEQHQHHWRVAAATAAAEDQPTPPCQRRCAVHGNPAGAPPSDSLDFRKTSAATAAGANPHCAKGLSHHSYCK